MIERLEQWFAAKQWRPFAFQRDAWRAYLNGRSGLVHAPTGMGKTYAVWLGPLAHCLAAHPGEQAWPTSTPLTVLWITPLRALANDTAAALQEPVTHLGLPWRIEVRTGDTSSHIKKRQRESLPAVLITTPESLSLLLSYPEARLRMASLQAVIVDEWHELLGSKRGVQTELALARLRQFAPGLRTWGLSATIGNLEEALQVLAGSTISGMAPVLIRGAVAKKIEIDTIMPEHIDRFPKAGHLGLKLLNAVVEAIDGAGTTLLFTNTRSQAELWYQALLRARPDWLAQLAIHHGSIDKQVREAIEGHLRTGTLKCVVCTSSLDLGVDFSPVEQVIQLGSPKGVARLMQRAGRSGHQPGAVSRIRCVPTNAFELIEYAAARRAIAGGRIETRPPLTLALDVLAQHVVTIALGGGFASDELLAEVRTTHAFRELKDEEWRWVLDFVTRGGSVLGAYPHFHKVQEQDGRFAVESTEIARRHRMSIGTITSDGELRLRFVRGPSLGTIEEAFIARLRPGDCFVFAGRLLELARVRDMTAYVRRASRSNGALPRWMGGRMPLSTQLAGSVQELLDQARLGCFDGAEMQAVAPLLALQARWSQIPGPDDVLIELTRSREGHHAFLFPFAGRLVHEGLAQLVAFRMAQQQPRTVSTMVTDYGIEFVSPLPFAAEAGAWRDWLRRDDLLGDLLACLNATELARRKFREIARVAGLVFQGYPGRSKSARQVQASSGLLYDVFARYDPENLLLTQARREVLAQQLELSRLQQTLAELARRRLVLRHVPRLTPFSFPIWAERIESHTVSSEKWRDRVERMLAQLEQAASHEEEVTT